MENQLMELKFEGTAVRIVKDENGEPWFVAKDVCEVLELGNNREATSRLDDDEKGVSNVDTRGGVQEMITVSESGLYGLVLTSRKPEAKKFKRWLTHEVLPAIRKTGKFELSHIDALKELIISLETQKQLEAQLAIAAPKVEFFDAVADSKDAIEMGKVAKVLDCGIGRNKLFDILRQKQILMNDNVPYQQYVDRGYFRVVEQKYNTPDGTVHVTTKTLVYQKGLQFIMRCLQPALAAAI